MLPSRMEKRTHSPVFSQVGRLYATITMIE